jgi:iron(III) transport system ATP-binding protein
MFDLGRTRERTPRGRAGAAIATSLAFERLRHAYGSTEAVRDVTLAVEPGEVLGLLGPSGCGKSTLLRLAAGLERPKAGRVLIDGVEMSSPAAVVPPERRGVGLMFQDFALFPHLTVLGNVAFGLSKVPRADALRTARAALARVGLESRADDYPDRLSGGEQQRVALARAVAPKPGLLLMDEPFSGLDTRLRDDIRAETLAVMRETRATCLVVTHDPEEAMRMSDRIALMREGRLVQVGTPAELYDRPVDLAVARFFGEVNVVPGIVRGGLAATPLGDVPAPGQADGAAVDVAVRLQDLAVLRAGQGTPGRLLRRRFLGEVDLLEVAVAGLDNALFARARAGGDLKPGDDVAVRIAGAALVFPAT